MEQLSKSDKKLDAFILASEKRWAERRELEELKDRAAQKDKEYEERIRLIEKILYTGIGGLAIIQLYITYFVL